MWAWEIYLAVASLDLHGLPDGLEFAVKKKSFLSFDMASAKSWLSMARMIWSINVCTVLICVLTYPIYIYKICANARSGQLPEMLVLN